MLQRCSFFLTCATVVAVFCAPDLAAQQLIAPRIGGATNMSQGVQPETVPLSRAMGLTDLRDGMPWGRIERSPGRYVFVDPRVRFPNDLTPGMRLGIVINWGNRLYDDGHTPQSPEALAALTSYVAALVDHFDTIGTIEVGNEFNGVNFVRGPMTEMAPLERARAYVPMLRATSEAARRQNPDIRVLGGATHSMPGAWLWEILDAGGAAWMDAVAIHPYTTPAEQFVRQAAVLRRHPALADMPFEVTEFGTGDPAQAASHLLRNYCQFALGGVDRAIWFPANLRGVKMVPLFTPKGRLTTAGQAFQLVSDKMAGRPVADAAPDAFSYGCQFGADVLVLWGMPRPVTVAPEVTALDATGQARSGPFALSETDPLVFVAPDVADKVTVAASQVLADSYHQFAYPLAEETMAPGDGFARFARQDTRMIALPTQPGQEKRGVPWFPYRSHPDHPGLRLTAEVLLPDRNKDIVHRYTAPADQTVRLRVDLSPSARSEDGVTLTLMVNGTPLGSTVTATRTAAVALDLPGIALAAGDQLDLVVGTNSTPRGDLSGYRFTVLSAD
jgi:hypothetical protein